MSPLLHLPHAPQHGTGVHFIGKGGGFSGHDDYRDLFLKYAVAALGLNYGDRQYGRHVKQRAHRIEGVARRRKLVQGDQVPGPGGWLIRPL